MMKQATRKLRSRAGESIGETLVALLISALALLMLAGAISSAGRIVTRNKESMDTYYKTAAESNNQIAVQNKWNGNSTISGLK